MTLLLIAPPMLGYNPDGMEDLEELGEGPLYCRVCDQLGHACVTRLELDGEPVRVFLTARRGELQGKVEEDAQAGAAAWAWHEAPICAGCGCTDDRGCGSGCSWSGEGRWIHVGTATGCLPLCSVCIPQIARPPEPSEMQVEDTGRTFKGRRVLKLTGPRDQVLDYMEAGAGEGYELATLQAVRELIAVEAHVDLGSGAIPLCMYYWAGDRWEGAPIPAAE